MVWDKVVLLGDSITRRSFDPNTGSWGGSLAHYLGDYFDVDMRAFQGYNSKWVLEIMSQLFPRSYLDKVFLFIIFLGHNDAWDETVPMHLPVERYEANMRGIVNYLENNGLGREKIVFISPAWYVPRKFEEYNLMLKFPILKKNWTESKKYADTANRLGQELHIETIDFFKMTSEVANFEEYVDDGCHLSRKGGKLLWDELKRIVDRRVEEKFKMSVAHLYKIPNLLEQKEVLPTFAGYYVGVTASGKMTPEIPE